MAFDSNKALAQIERAEKELIKITTQKETAMQTLETNYGISSIKEGDTWLNKQDEKITAMEKELGEKEKALEEGFPWE